MISLSRHPPREPDMTDPRRPPGSQGKPQPDAERARLDDRLEEGLEESFPASDPPSAVHRQDEELF